MTLSEHYPFRFSSSLLAYGFQSIGKQGVINKIVIFDRIEKNRYNFGFGDFLDGKIEDKIVSNNDDLVMVISTVAACAYDFFERYPKAVLEIQAVDERRLNLYNRIFKNRHLEMQDLFVIEGYMDGQKVPYHPNQFYQKFEIRLKKI